MAIRHGGVIAEGGVPRGFDASTAPHFRGGLGRFASAVAIVAFGGSARRHGVTANSFTSDSMDPPLVPVSITRKSKDRGELARRPFAANLRGAEPWGLALHFAGRGSGEPAWIEGAAAPRLAGALAHSCRAPPAATRWPSPIQPSP